MNAESASLLRQIRVVLVSPSHPGNIGAAARAMKTMGLSQLWIVAPRCQIDEQAEALAAGGIDVLRQHQICESLAEALAKCRFAVATSARVRDLAPQATSARTAAQQLLQNARHGEVALVFGREDRGLSNREVALTQLLAHIPCATDGGSLNLAQAVQVLAYEAFLAAGTSNNEPQASTRPARQLDVEHLVSHVEQVMFDTGFLLPERPRRLMARVRRMLARARLEDGEVKILRGFLTTIQRAVRKVE